VVNFQAFSPFHPMNVGGLVAVCFAVGKGSVCRKNRKKQIYALCCARRGRHRVVHGESPDAEPSICEANRNRPCVINEKRPERIKYKNTHAHTRISDATNDSMRNSS